jgi:hypothetical protein
MANSPGSGRTLNIVFGITNTILGGLFLLYLSLYHGANEMLDAANRRNDSLEGQHVQLTQDKELFQQRLADLRSTVDAMRSLDERMTLYSLDFDSYDRFEVQKRRGFQVSAGTCGAKPCFQMRVLGVEEDHQGQPVINLRVGDVPSGIRVHGAVDLHTDLGTGMTLVMPLKPGCRHRMWIPKYDVEVVIEEISYESVSMGVASARSSEARKEARGVGVVCP